MLTLSHLSIPAISQRVLWYSPGWEFARPRYNVSRDSRTFIHLIDATNYALDIATSDFLGNLDGWCIYDELGASGVVLEPLLGNLDGCSNPQGRAITSHDNSMDMDVNMGMDLNMDEDDSGRQVASMGGPSGLSSKSE
jgi:hypothetical protein